MPPVATPDRQQAVHGPGPCAAASRFLHAAASAAMVLAGLTAVVAGPSVWAQPLPSAHRVQPGDTLWEISRQHLNDPLRWTELQRDNTVRVPERLQPGQLLTLPSAQALLRVLELKGIGWVKREGQPQQALMPGMALQLGDVLVTDRQAFLSLALADGSRVVMPSSSAVRIAVAQGGRVRLDLLQGRLESHIEKQNRRHFEIRTRNAGLGVRGTEFRVRDEEGVSTVEVLEGAVSVRALTPGAPEILLAGGQGAPLEGLAALQARALLPPPTRLAPGSPGQVDAAPLPEAIRYRLQLARDERFLLRMHDMQSTVPSFALPASLAAGFYHLRLTAFDADQVEGLPADGVLHVQSLPVTASVRIYPDGRVDIRWPEGGAAPRVFELARTPDFEPLVAREVMRGAQGASVGPLTVAGRYHWRVRGMDEQGRGTGQAHAAGSFEWPVP